MPNAIRSLLVSVEIGQSRTGWDDIPELLSIDWGTVTAWEGEELAKNLTKGISYTAVLQAFSDEEWFLYPMPEHPLVRPTDRGVMYTFQKLIESEIGQVAPSVDIE